MGAPYASCVQRQVGARGRLLWNSWLDATQRPTHMYMAKQMFRLDVHLHVEIQQMPEATSSLRATVMYLIYLETQRRVLYLHILSGMRILVHVRGNLLDLYGCLGPTPRLQTFQNDFLIGFPPPLFRCKWQSWRRSVSTRHCMYPIHISTRTSDVCFYLCIIVKRAFVSGGDNFTNHIYKIYDIWHNLYANSLFKLQ